MQSKGNIQNYFKMRKGEGIKTVLALFNLICENKGSLKLMN